jgi:uncharacterized protein (UPF0333 family)
MRREENASAKGRRRKMKDSSTVVIDSRGQDITEYTLLLAFVVIAAVVIFLISSDNITGIWKASSTTVSSANAVAGS